METQVILSSSANVEGTGGGRERGYNNMWQD